LVNSIEATSGWDELRDKEAKYSSHTLHGHWSRTDLVKCL